MEIYITGDLHGDLRRFPPGIFYEQEALKKEDIVWWLETSDVFGEAMGGTVLYHGHCHREPRKLRCPVEVSAGNMAGREHPAYPPLGDPAGAGIDIQSGWKTVFHHGRGQRSRHPS